MLSDHLKKIKTTLIRSSTIRMCSGRNKHLLPTEILGEFKILYYKCSIQTYWNTLFTLPKLLWHKSIYL